MRRIAGGLLLLIGLLPLVGLAALVSMIWARHMYPVGLSATQTGKGILAGLAATDLACLAAGTRLWRSGRKSAT